jgi:molecular chaperone DnaK (HSP70)
MIGIKLADGSFYPVLEEGVPKTKKLTLTTVRDNQESVHIILVRGDSGGDLSFIRELFLSGLESAPGGNPDITLTLSLNKDLLLSARLEAPGMSPAELCYEAPRGPGGGIFKRKKRKGRQNKALKYRESSVPSDISDGELAASGVCLRPNAVSLAAFVILGLFICAVLAFAFFQAFKAPQQPPLGMIPALRVPGV